MVEQTPVALNRTAVPARRERPPTGAALTPKEIFLILRRHILLIIGLTALGFIVGGGIWYLLLRYHPKYTAETYIKVLPPTEKDPITIGGDALVNKDIQYGHRLSIANLIKQQTILSELINRNKVRETNWFKRPAKFNEEGEIENIGHCVVKAFKDLKKHFGAYAHRDAEFVVLSMTCGDAKEAATIVNEMVDLFLTKQTNIKKGEVHKKLAKLDDQIVSVQKEYNSSEGTLKDIRDRFKLTDLGGPERRYYQHTITLTLNELEREQKTLLMDIQQVHANIKNLEELAKGPISVQVEHLIETDPIMLMLAQQRDFQESQLAGRLTKFGKNHRAVRQTQELINELKEKRRIRRLEIAEQTRQSNLKNAQDILVVLKSRYKELENLRDESLAEQKQLDLARAEYEQELAIRDERKEMLDSLKEQREKLRILAEDPETPKVQSVGYAPEPIEVSSPMWEFYFPGGTILGLICGIGIAFLIEVLNDFVRTSSDVARYLRIPLLGVIPDAAEDEQAQDIDLSHVVRQAPYSIISESYRRLRTNLKLSGSGTPESLKVLLVSSGMAGDGKTSVSVNLAATFIAENKKVLLIDTNFRRPSLHTLFPKTGPQSSTVKQPDFGLSNLMLGQCNYQQVVRPNVIEGLDVIDSGPLPSNPAELLGGAQMEQLIKQQRQNYDYVIVDSPPVLLVSDTKLLARLVDGTILVFNASATRRGAALRTIRELKEVNATIVGCVLFAARAMKGGYFQEQYKSYRQYQKLQLAKSI